MPVRHIENVLKQKKTFGSAYAILRWQLNIVNDTGSRPVFRELKNPRPKRRIEEILIASGDSLPKELHKARQEQEEFAGKIQP